jgi:DinB superfamily
VPFQSLISRCIIGAMTPATSLEAPQMAAFIKDFRETIDQASDRLLSMTDDQSEQPRAAEKWSPKLIIGHLIDSATNNHQRFVRAQFTDELVFPGYQQEEWIRVQNYRQESWHDLVQLWKFYNQHIAHIMAAVPEAERSKLRYKHNLNELASDQISASEPVTLDFFMRDYVDHLKKHLSQIFG